MTSRPILAAVVLAAPLVVHAAQDTFEVAAIRPLGELPATQSFSVFQPQRGGRFDARRATVVDLIRYAYRLPNNLRIEGGPSWAREQRFDVAAVSPVKSDDLAILDPPGEIGPIRRMLQQLLAERFQLVMHIQKRSVPGYALVLARSDRQLGPQIRRSQLDCEALRAARSARLAQGGDPLAPENRMDTLCGSNGRDGWTRFRGDTMKGFASWLSSIHLQQAPVLDQTGLDGAYDFEINVAPYLSPQQRAVVGADADPYASGPPLDVALSQQLGLKLERITVDVEYYIIDRVERPSPN